MNELRRVIAVVENNFCGVVVVDNAVVLQCSEYPLDKRNSHTSWVSSEWSYRDLLESEPALANNKQGTVDSASTGERLFGVVRREPPSTPLQPPVNSNEGNGTRPAVLWTHVELLEMPPHVC